MAEGEGGVTTAIGTEVEQLARLDHLTEKHGMRARNCPTCSGRGCRICDGLGVVFSRPVLNCEDPNCEATRVMRSRMT
jgi:Zn-dependent alcohol dehydrogenase